MPSLSEKEEGGYFHWTRSLHTLWGVEKYVRAELIQDYVNIHRHTSPLTSRRASLPADRRGLWLHIGRGRDEPSGEAVRHRRQQVRAEQAHTGGEGGFGHLRGERGVGHRYRAVHRRGQAQGGGCTMLREILRRRKGGREESGPRGL